MKVIDGAEAATGAGVVNVRNIGRKTVKVAGAAAAAFCAEFSFRMRQIYQSLKKPARNGQAFYLTFKLKA